MHNPEISNKIFLGVVEDNADPKRLGRVRVRIPTYFDNIPTENLPWASPWKDLNGNEYSSPDVGKIVSVVFDQGNPYLPEYIYAEHFNINLENKLKSLSESDYLSFKSVFFDDKTQIYRSDSEGLKIDHQYSNMNITQNGNINLNLRDNSANLNLGSPDAQQQVVLGTDFMQWMDEFVNVLLKSPYFSSDGPVIPLPKMVEVLLKYKSLRLDKFLSTHVRVPNNRSIKAQKRDAINQKGDNWSSTQKKNNPNARKSS
jgi:hypothetical protein